MTERYLVEPPYGAAVAGRGLLIQRQVEARAPAATEYSGKDISSRWTYKLRAWDEADVTTLVIDDAIAASSTQDTAGWLDDYIPLGTTTYDTLLWEIVEIDGDNVDASTPSGQREIVLERWRQPIIAAPTA